MSATSTEEGLDTFKTVIDAEPGKVFYDAFEDGIRVLVLRGPFHMCAYLGIPEDHPLAGFSYDDIPLRVHGGLTYSGEGVTGAPEGFHWFGWDYGHAGDKCVYHDGIPDHHKDSHGWTPKEVIAEAKEAVWDFRRLVLLAERIALKDSWLLLAKDRR